VRRVESPQAAQQMMLYVPARPETRGAARGDRSRAWRPKCHGVVPPIRPLYLQGMLEKH
jgi:hypothetical protein